MILTIFVSDSNSYEQVQAEDEEVSLVAFVDEAEHHELLDVIRESSGSEMRVCCTNVTSSEIEEELQRKRACIVRGHMDGMKLYEIAQHQLWSAKKHLRRLSTRRRCTIICPNVQTCQCSFLASSF